MSARWLAAALALVLLSGAVPAHAYFDEVIGGARATGLGGELPAGDTDVSALRWNPALLGALDVPEVVLDHARPFVVDDLAINAVTVGGRWRGTGVAVGWHRLGIANAYSEDLVSLGAGRRVRAWHSGHALSAGAAYKFMRVGFQPFTVEGTGEGVDYGSQAKGSLDVGLVWDTPWRMQFAWSAHDVLQPRFRFIPGGGGGLVPTRQDFGMAWKWNPESTMLASIGRPLGVGHPTVNLGLEIWFYKTFAIRTGLTNTSAIYQAGITPNDFQFAGGFGVQHDGIRVDAAALTNHELGVSYQASLAIPLRKAPR